MIMFLNKNEKIKVYQDTDNNPMTITVDLDVESYQFSLIYKD